MSGLTTLVAGQCSWQRHHRDQWSDQAPAIRRPITHSRVGAINAGIGNPAGDNG